MHALKHLNHKNLTLHCTSLMHALAQKLNAFTSLEMYGILLCVNILMTIGSNFYCYE